jgi:hypothetical protein
MSKNPILCLLVLLAPGSPAEDLRPWSEQPFLGLSVRDSEHGLVIGWIRPGPLGGLGLESDSGIRRGDILVAVNGQAVDRQGYELLLASQSPGDAVELTVRRSPDASATSSVPRGGPGGPERTIEVVLASRDVWAGTIRRGLGGRVIPEPQAGELEAMLLEAAAEVGARTGDGRAGTGLDDLLAYLRATLEENLDPNSLPAVVNAFRRPLSLDRLDQELDNLAARAGQGDPAAIETLILQVLDLPPPDRMIQEVMEQPVQELDPGATRSMVRFCGQHMHQYQGQHDARLELEQLLRRLRTDADIFDAQAEAHLRVINGVLGDRLETLLALPLGMLRLTPESWRQQAAAHADAEALEALPAELGDAVEGDLLWVGHDVMGALAVVGGRGPNRYDMRRVGAVYDLGGDDRYEYGPSEEHGPVLVLRCIIDLDGNDVHEGTGDFAGPATAVYGLSWLEDHAGDDLYRSRHQGGIGAGLVGFGILIDRAGNDRYENLGPASGWSIGVGVAGAGLVIDQGGTDTYLAEVLSQGVGGPRGLGAILDASGNDLYMADGPSVSSAYGTPAVFLGLSQGVGIGIRGYAMGGVGLINDRAGHDRYVAGEFGQAGGYYWGLGVLHDVEGNDLYHGNRYGQAFAAHQAVGILVDEAGDDTYWSMTAASQAGTWDQSLGLLLDRAGHDSYRCDGLGQGAAAMQSIAVLVDLAGTDRYTGAAASVQGCGGGNRYHFDADGVLSFSALVDTGGSTDLYSSGRANDALTPTGSWNEDRPGASTLHGLTLDR